MLIAGIISFQRFNSLAHISNEGRRAFTFDMNGYFIEVKVLRTYPRYQLINKDLPTLNITDIYDFHF